MIPQLELFDDAGEPEPDAAVENSDELISDAELYQQAVAIVVRDRKASTSYVQRCLGIGYNRAAQMIERMEREGIVSLANHVGTREVLREPGDEVA